MRTIVLILIGFCFFVSCKNDPKKDVVVEESQPEINGGKTGTKELKGEFIYYADAAVLQTPTEVYGVVIDSMMHVLDDQVKAYKKEVTDMVPVAIKGKVITKDDNEEGWPYKVQILEVLKVYEPQPESNNVIKLEKQTE